MRELLMGARLAFTGGRDGWTRAVLTAVGVGIGVAMLLLAAAVPGALGARHDRGAARDDMLIGVEVPRSDRSLLVGMADTAFRGVPVRGRLMQPEGPNAPVPPGVKALPRPGELVVSPALAELLEAPDGALLKQRIGGTVVGTIADEGLAGPRELAYVAGVDGLEQGGPVYRIDAFGGGSEGEPLGPVLTLLVVIIFVVLLLPIAVFIGAAVRFGGERRDRRLAALRLVGADAAMTRRIAAGEAAAGALLGLAVGGGLFLAGRQIVPLVSLWDISVFAADVRPSLTLVAAIALAVPAVAVAVSIVALRRTVIEPLGVVRSATTARRTWWWRLILPALGAGLLLAMAGGVGPGGEYQAVAGAGLLLVGSVAVLPWLIEIVVRRFGGGPVPWQLAVRRLQADAGTSARLVSGIVVAVAGTIGLQMLFSGVQNEFTTATGQDETRAQVQVHVFDLAGDAATAALRDLGRTPGVQGQTGGLYGLATAKPAPGTTEPRTTAVMVGECAVLADFAAVDRCTDGDVFVVRQPGDDPQAAVAAGTSLTLGEQGPKWRIPATAATVPGRPDPSGSQSVGVLATPGALDAGRLPAIGLRTFLRLDPARPDGIEHVRNTVATIDPMASVGRLRGVEESSRFVNIRRGLYIGIVVTLLLIGASMLVGVLEQLRERRRLLAMLVAVGTRRSTLSWSVLWQAVLPMALGLALATAFGISLGAILQTMVEMPVWVDWSVVAASTGIAATVVLLVTAVSLPALWRLIRPEALRTE